MKAIDGQTRRGIGWRVAAPLLVAASAEVWLIWLAFRSLSGDGALGLLLIAGMIAAGYAVCLIAFAVACGRRRSTETINWWRAVATVAILVALAHLVCVGFLIPVAKELGLSASYVGTLVGACAVGRSRLVRA